MVSVCLPSDALSHHLHLTWVSLTLDMGFLLLATAPDLGRGVAPLGHASAQSIAAGALLLELDMQQQTGSK